jgi:hypothetical protein
MKSCAVILNVLVGTNITISQSPNSNFPTDRDPSREAKFLLSRNLPICIYLQLYAAQNSIAGMHGVDLHSTTLPRCFLA